ncbi:MAG: aminotransferase class I/II-fold pyridoxal phosphate-dependent enzyme [Gemmatimonadetes bacterium]|nr:aminotransferase class I/II-fold pyridoxal phosphate-dependent enzyme [Gemmatimonadota bacterium]
MSIPFSTFASSIRVETAFSVLAVAKLLKSEGKDVVELEIGDSPFSTPAVAVDAAARAIREGQTRYGPSLGMPEYRAAAARYVNREYGLNVAAENVIAGQGAKIFEQLFCEAFLNPGDGVLVFSPHFPTYPPNIERRGARVVLSRLEAAREFRPDPAEVRRFIDRDPSPRAIFLNSPHNPTGGVATLDDFRAIADAVRDTEVVILSDEPYDRMVWKGRHHSPLEVPGMMERTVAAYTFSKSFSMSGWRLGFAVSDARIIDMMGKLTNTTLSCVPPFVQMAGIAALDNASDERDRTMQEFKRKVELLVTALGRLDGITCAMPVGSFYVFPSVAGVCNRLGITSHGLAMYLLEGADEKRGVACLGGECFGDAGAGFLRLSCAEPDERLTQAVDFIADAVTRGDRVKKYLAAHPEYRLAAGYPAS